MPGLAAKPIVDILVAVADVQEPSLTARLEAAGYVLRVREPGHRMLRTPGLDVHVHVWAADGRQIDRHLRFRDHLRRDASDRRRYEQLKQRLALRDWCGMNDYAAAKSGLIEEMLVRAAEKH